MRPAKFNARFGRILLTTLLMATLSAATASAQQDAQSPASPLLLRELYVPVKEFAKLREQHPEGVLMDLTEYRALVELGIARGATGAPVTLPPIESLVTQAEYAGRVGGKTARFTAKLQVAVTRDGWVLCDLGRPLAALGSVRIHGEPGWIILDKAGASLRRDAGQQAKKDAKKKSETRAYLLLRGRGRHEVELTFSLPVQRDTERSSVAGRLVHAATSVLELRVPGRAEGKSNPNTLQSLQEVEGNQETTRFRIALGQAQEFSIEWRGRKTVGDNPVLLSAEHRLTVLANVGYPAFSWTASLEIARQRTASVVLRPPSGSEVVDVSGPLVHTWEIVEGDVQVVLKEPFAGRTELKLQGFLPMEDAGFALEAPRLLGAYSDRGYIAVQSARTQAVTVESTTGLEELAIEETSVPTLGIVGAGSLRYLYRYRTPEASLRGRIADVEPVFLTREAFLLRVSEEAVRLHGRVRVEVRKGRVFSLDLAVPGPWKLTRLEEVRPAKGTPHVVRTEETGTAASPRVRLTLDRAASVSTPLEFEAHFEHAELEPGREWDSRALDLILPTLESRVRSETAVGISLTSSLDLLTTDFPEWHAMSKGEGNVLGLLEGPEGNSKDVLRPRLVAVLKTHSLAPSLGLLVGHRAARGEYRCVTHLLAAEDNLRVRADFHLAVVDRGIEELVFMLPSLPDGVTVVLLGDGIRERLPDLSAGEYRVRFVKPWLGSRSIRIEYELPLSHGTPAVIPDIRLGQDYGGERFVVMQSRGAVEVAAVPGAGLVSIEVDDVPDFARAWKDGRVLGAYRYLASGEKGTVVTTLHDSAPLLSHLARSVVLRTVIAEDGTTRTEAEILLAYARLQSLTVDLPLGSRLLAVRLNGEPIRAVRREGDDGEIESVSIPLPPQSYASITIAYEQLPNSVAAVATSGTVVGTRVALGGSGSWQEQGPVLRGSTIRAGAAVLSEIPVGETQWHVYHPEGFRFYIADGNLRPVDSDAERREESFAQSFFGRLLSGRMPVFTTFQTEYPVRDIAKVPPLTPEELRGAAPSRGEEDDKGRIRPKGQTPEGVPQGKAPPTPLYEVHPRGRHLELFKIGGNATLDLSYLEFSWWHGARKAVFTVTLIASLFLTRRREQRTFWRWILWGLVVGTLAPYSIGWESPLLCVPFCEGLVAAALLTVVTRVLLWIAARCMALPKRIGRRRRILASTAARLLLATAIGVLFFAASGPATAQEKPPHAELVPYDTVWIPYPAGTRPDPGSLKAYVSENHFRQLWERAHPESEKPRPYPRDLELGSALYTLKTEGTKYRLSGTIPVQVFSDRWVSLKLAVDRARLISVKLDGIEQGVSQKDGVPIVEWKGAGRHHLDIELQGVIESDLGEFRIRTKLLKGAVASVEAELPGGAEVRTRGTAPGAFVVVDAEKTMASLDLGGSDTLELVWSFPKQEGQSGSQVRSLSYTALALSLDGFEIGRRERLEVTGRPVDRAAYQILGSWEIRDVVGPEVAEWNVVTTTESPDQRLLQVFFSQPVQRAEFGVYGRAVVSTQAPLASLSIEGGVKQESYFGLHNGADQRFHADSLKGLTRASYSEARSIFGLPEQDSPDRMYHAFSNASGETVRVSPVVHEAQLTTEAVAFLRADRLQIFVRVRYGKAAPGPMRYQVALPTGWNVLRVRSPALLSWDVTPTPAGRDLTIDWKQRPTTGMEAIWVAELRLEDAGRAFSLPFLKTRVRPEDRIEETVYWILAADNLLELTTPQRARWESVELATAPAWVGLPQDHSYRYAFRSKRADASLEVQATPGSSRLHVTSVAFARIADDWLHVNVHLEFDIVRGGEDRFRLRLPPGAELVTLETTNLRSRNVEEDAAGPLVDVYLQSPATSRHSLELMYRVRRDPSTAPRVLPVAILAASGRLQGVDQYVGVVQTAHTYTLETRVQNLVAEEPENLPYLPEGISARSLSLTYRATGLDWAVELGEEKVEIAEGPSAVVRIADLTTLIGGDGTRRTRALYILRNQGLQFLAITLPPMADLWGVTINGQGVAVGGDAPASAPGTSSGRTIRIPLEHSGRSELPLEVAVDYEEEPISMPLFRGVADLRSPRVVSPGVRVQTTLWSVRLPDGYWVSETGGKMRQILTSQKHAEKVKHLLDDKTKVLSLVQEARSRRARERAERDLARLEQALGDNLAELEATNRDVAEGQRLTQIGAADAEKEWGRNESLIQQARDEQKALRKVRKEQAETGKASADEQAFSDRTQFLQGRNWRGGRKGQQPVQQRQRQPEKARTAYSMLLEHDAFKGWSGAALPGTRPEAESATAQAIDDKAGLEPLPESRRYIASPGLEIVRGTDEDLAYTFRQAGGEASLRLTLTRQGSLPRIAAFVMVLVLAGYVGWRWRKSRA